MATRAQFGDLLEPGFRKIYDDVYSEIPEQFPRVLKVGTSTKSFEKDSAVSGFGMLQVTGETDPTPYEDPNQGYDVSYVHQKYTKGFKVSWEMYEDDQYNVMNRKPQALARAARRTAEYYAANVFNNGFSTSYLGGDAKPLFSTSHPRSDGGTAQSNASAVGLVLNETNLNTGLLAMRNQVDDKGMKIMAKADAIVVGPTLEKTAKILTQTNGRPNTADNDINVYNGMEVIVLDYLTSTTQWMLVDKQLHEVRWFWRARPEFKQGDAFDTDLALYKVRTRFSKGWSDYRGVWGSKGDGAAYAS
jgi:phage major head subunit gpT-like protein